jgi:hypothetical protein
MQSLIQPKTRSNRPLTQFACGCLDLFLSLPGYRTDRSKGNTTIKCFKDEPFRKFKTFVDDEEVLELIVFQDEPVAVKVSTGDLLDDDGHPVDYVVERLNGLLDSLGTHRIIPFGVRMFYDKTDEVFCLGKGEQKIPVGLLHASQVIIEADSFELKMTLEQENVNA